MDDPRRPAMLWAAFDFPRHPLAREDGERVRGCFVQPPARRLVARDPVSLRAVLREAHAASQAGAWVLGGVRYEAAGALDPALDTAAIFEATSATTRATGALPLSPAERGHAEGTMSAGAVDARPLLAEFAVWDIAPQPWPATEALRAHDLSAWQDVQSDAAEADQIERVRNYIRAGDCYQVNLCTRVRAQAGPDFDPVAYFFALHAAQPGGFALLLRLADGDTVASVSPELFFDWRPLPETPEATHTWLLSTQPMKGTAPRGRDRAADEAAQAYLRTSEKERAENLMIVDLLRNDLSRVAVTGSVRVPRLFELHALPTVWQMTSTVSAISRAGLALDDLFTALFPCGSVTGAPKRRAMQIIHELEPGQRGWYTGALGLMQPGGAATFNVPIRTVTLRQDGGAECGVGSAITLDSAAAAEIDEWRAKLRFLSRAQAPIEALETLRLEDGVFQREARHLQRLHRTLRHFNLQAGLEPVRERLAAIAAAHPAGLWRVRITVGRQGEWTQQIQPLVHDTSPVWVALARTPVDARGPDAEFLQHKTTRRAIYQAHLDHKPADCLDVLLFNRDGELTEGCLTNLAVQLDGPDGPWLTPPLDAGLLPGVMREELLEQGRIREARLHLDDLRRAHALAVFNSVRGWRDARLLPQDLS
ncbi:chorismate-binding protein [Roseateles depolymerans]|uniref:Putative p-aminobenzoate-synthase component n=1 Tax=Roseateles depolymerans TaxID=76731 RepID=A0A0U3MKM3_9BURK|nr:chorismate-binding protein [Roseateles depolymerans]ALV08012.1 putative p-aminobenzoate-synthase component [Roseateles depolymerans]REG21768.1 para-aminobenzoate synthetase/4-amino-4-deoxychorismate lyase [Roseateles depolymerans]